MLRPMASNSHNRQTDAALLATSRSGHRKPPRQKAPETYEEKLAQLTNAPELGAAPEPVAEQVTTVLAATLERLGAADHRPFSRS
jgi:hypothetical protein